MSRAQGNPDAAKRPEEREGGTAHGGRRRDAGRGLLGAVDAVGRSGAGRAADLAPHGVVLQRHRPLFRRGAILVMEPRAGVRLLLEAAADRLDHSYVNRNLRDFGVLRSAALAARLYDARIGFWSALVYATLPGVSLSAGIISTDVPLLFFWALALYAVVALIDGRSWWPAWLLGLGLGLGLNAKYAMAYFLLCGTLYVIATPERRWLLRDARLYAALALALLLIAPNLVWNHRNGFATFAHTADNAKWTGSLFNPGNALEFFAAQFGVFGPILFGALVAITGRASRERLPAADRLLMALALPVLIAVTVQALLSRAHANWAAVSYVAATVLVTAMLVRDQAWRWLRASLALHALFVALIALATAYAGSFRLPGAGNPFARTLGWRALALETKGLLEARRQSGEPFGTVVTDDRGVTAELLYYLRGEGAPVLAWRAEGLPRDHYELTRPFAPGAAEPVLFVSLRRDVGKVTRHFTVSERLSERQIPAGAGAPRRVAFYRLQGYTGK